MANKRNKTKKRRRLFHDNRYTKQKTVPSEQAAHEDSTATNPDPIIDTPTTSPTPCTSLTKLNISIVEQPAEVHDKFFFFCHFHALKTLISNIGTCSQCKANHLELSYVDTMTKGFSTRFNVACINCDWTSQAHPNFVFLVGIHEVPNHKRLTIAW